MKKIIKTALFLLLALVGLCIAGVGVMFFTDLCPPQGPWLMPPWCSAEDGSSLSIPSLPEGLPQLPEELIQGINQNPYPAENTWGYVPPTPTLAVGSPVKIVFEVALPRHEEETFVNLDGEAYPLTTENGFYFVSEPIRATAGDSLTYYFSSGNLLTETQTTTPNSDFVVRDGLNWLSDEKLSKPDFIKGFGMMDFGGFNISELRGGRLPSILASMQSNGGEWFIFDYYWSYTDYTLPEMVDESQYPDMQYPTEADLENMADIVHGQDMKFALLASLEWSAIPGNPCHQYHGDADKLADCSNQYWLEGQAYEKEMLERLTQNPEDAEAAAYRDEWFAQYQNYLLFLAQVAEKNQIDMLVLGKQTVFAKSPIHEQYWRDLIAAVREVYHGKLALIYECYNDSCLTTQPWVDDVDVAVLFYWFRISEADDPSPEILRAEMTRISDSVIGPFFQKYNLPIVVLTPFMSRDHPARQDWVEPASSAPEVGQDMQGQAELYELLFETSINEAWFQGVMPYGYWFFDGFHKDFAFDRSYNVRNKPASVILRSWFSRIDNAP